MGTSQVYRSVKFVLQNSTNETLTIQGFGVLVGNWADKMAPIQGMQIGEQSAADWSSISTVLGAGTSAFIRFGSSRGYSMVRWQLPWSGHFDHSVENAPHMKLEVEVEKGQPDAIVLFATFTEETTQ